MPDFKRAFRTCLLLQIVRENSIVDAQWEMQFEVKLHIDNIILRQHNMVGWANFEKIAQIIKRIFSTRIFCNECLKCQRFVSQSSPNRPFMTDPSFRQY